MELFRQASRSGRRLGLGVGAVLLAVISASCTAPPPAPPTGHPPQPNQTYRFEDEYNTFKATSTDPTKRPWFCHALGSGAHEHAASTPVEQAPPLPVPAYEGLVRGALSWDDCLANARA